MDKSKNIFRFCGYYKGEPFAKYIFELTKSRSKRAFKRKYPHLYYSRIIQFQK